jgi:light-regulated signal transduction histidine kinase (bacteriophytochrome)
MINSLDASSERIAELEQSLAQRTRELEAARNELDAFSYSVSHDLRSPLRHILGYVQIFAEDHAAELEPQARQCLEKIHQGAQKMNEMLDELLKLSRLSRQKMLAQTVQLDGLVRETVRYLERDAKERRIEWHIDPLPEVKGDLELLRQLFVNVLANAIKFTRPRDPGVISVGTLHKEGETVFLVRDNGIGFDMKYADKLFTIFQRLHGRQEFAGVGAGLATAQRIVGKHGGRIWAEAELEKGAAFYFTLGADRLTGT